MSINEKQWSLINKITLQIHSMDDINLMRQRFLEVLPSLIDFDEASAYVQKGEDPYGDPIGIGLNDEDLRLYVDAYADKDPFAPLLNIFLENRSAIRSRDYAVNELIDDTDYYHRVWEPRNIYYSLLVPLSYEHHWLGSINLFRFKDKKDFSDEDIEIINTLKEHIEIRLWREKLYLYGDQKHVPDQKDGSVDPALAEEYNLTRRECEVINLWTQGLTDEEICNQLSISKNTLKKHISNIFGKLEISSRVELLKLQMRKD